MVTIIVRGSLKGVTPTLVLGDVVTRGTYREERVEVEKEENKKSVAFKATESSKGKSKKEEETSDDEDASSSSSVEDEEMTLFVCWFRKFKKKKNYGARRRRSSSKEGVKVL